MPSDLREFFTRIGHNAVEVDNRSCFGINQGLLKYSAGRREDLRQVYKADVIATRGGHEQRWIPSAPLGGSRHRELDPRGTQGSADLKGLRAQGARPSWSRVAQAAVITWGFGPDASTAADAPR
ncbi:hypothetical protein BDW27_113118 [Nocardiopsis sp. L17-MgMaSL7]|nr:hypothetical protein BDW27_113118 [Nocardiopsis sp. L17-MgMaSL7]